VVALFQAANAARKAAGLPAVPLDAERSRGCAAHARYLVRNAKRLAGRDGDEPGEDPDLPGASEAGQRAALASTVLRGEPAAVAAGWQGDAPLRALLLLGDLKTLGIGTVRDAQGNGLCVLDLTAGLDAARPPPPVVYPTPGQRDVPVYFPGNEVPDPLPDTTEKVTGYPITVTFPAGQEVVNARATLRDASGREFVAWPSSASQPANPRFVKNQMNSVCLIPKEPLRGGTTYFVQAAAEVSRRPWSQAWCFTTADERRSRAAALKEVLNGLNAARKVRGLRTVRLDTDRCRVCQAHARYIALNANLMLQGKLRPGDEEPGRPGFTPEGRQLASRCVSHVTGHPTPLFGVYLLQSAILRNVCLDAALQEIGLGSTPHPLDGRIWVLDLGTVAQAGPLKSLLVPADNEPNVPVEYPREERPLPVPARPGAALGPAISVRLPAGSRVSDVKAQLQTEAGKAVDFFVVAPNSTAYNPDAVCLLPKNPLKYHTKYRVSVRALAAYRPWRRSWSFTTCAAPEDTAADKEAAALRALNSVRRAAGLGPVTLDAGLSKNCYHHARYIARNADHPALQGLGMHSEDPKLPGYSEAGHRTGQASVIAVLPQVDTAVDRWMSTLYHRLPLLEPDLGRIGFGFARHPGGSWIAVLDYGTGRVR
jgi:uncharacterized protein YkwD